MARFVLILLLVLTVSGQTPADLYALEEYRAWAAGKTGDADLLERYKGYLQERGADAVDAESTVRVIRSLMAEASGGGLVAEVVKGRKPGRALEVRRGGGRHGASLARQGWAVTVVDPTKPTPTPFAADRWDLIVLQEVPVRDQEAVVGSLRLGGLLVIEGMGEGAAPKGLREVRRAGGSYCGERVR